MHQEAVVQPNAAPISEDLVRSILGLSLGAPLAGGPVSITTSGEFSNDLAEVRLRDGRAVIVKRGRYPWSEARFRVSRRVAELLRTQAGLVTPVSLDVPVDLDENALDVYWRIECPTLADVWPGLEPAERLTALRSLGECVGRVHELRLPGHGFLPPVESRLVSLSQFLAQDLRGRLMPSVSGHWEHGVSVVRALLELIPEVVKRAPADGVLLHGDLHLGNVLCEQAGDGFRAVGLLDLEGAHAGPLESDLARLWVIHSGPFNMEIEGEWFEAFVEGYGADPDPVLFGFYAVYHLVHLGHHSAMLGHLWHAEQVAAAASRELELLDRAKRDERDGIRRRRRRAAVHGAARLRTGTHRR